MDRPEGVSVRLLAPAPPSDFAHDYKLSYVVTLTTHQLSLDLHVVNTGTSEFKFQALLHGYFAVADSSKISINGIDAGVSYRDKALGGRVVEWTGGPLTITSETDRVYFGVPSQELTLHDSVNGKTVIRFKGFEEQVLYLRHSAELQLHNLEPSRSRREEDCRYGRRRLRRSGIPSLILIVQKHYVCIEPGVVRDFKTLQAGEEFLGQQIITVE